MADYSLKPIEQGLTLAITDLNTTREVVREEIETYFFEMMGNVSDVEFLNDPSIEYFDAFDWFLSNMCRIDSVQLYADGEIRLRIIKDAVEDGKICVFLKDSKMKNRALDQILYDELAQILEVGL